MGINGQRLKNDPSPMYTNKSGSLMVQTHELNDTSENYQVKLKLGFCVQPKKQADGTMGCYFLMRL